MINNTVMVEISHTGNNFCAYAPILLGCVATGATPHEVKKNIKDAIAFHIEGSLEDGDAIPEIFLGNYELVYKFDTISLLSYYKGVFTNSALEKITGINQKQIQHYATGHRKPRVEQRKKIETALHTLGKELLAVEL
jgi:predicted RNase H-like HicB family nuclease